MNGYEEDDEWWVRLTITPLRLAIKITEWPTLTLRPLWDLLFLNAKLNEQFSGENGIAFSKNVKQARKLNFQLQITDGFFFLQIFLVVCELF